MADVDGPGFDSGRVVYEPPPGGGSLPPGGGFLVTAEDLLGIVDVSGLTLSPDGRRVAYRVQSARLASDDHRAAWHVVSTVADGSAVDGPTAGGPTAGGPVADGSVVEVADGSVVEVGGGSAVEVGDAGRPVIEDGFLEGALHNGGPNPVAAWSPDGRRLAFQVHRGDRFRLCQAFPDGGTPIFTDLGGVVRVLRYSADGDRLLVRTSPQVPTPVRLARPAAGPGVLVGPESRPDAGITGLPAAPEPGEPTDWAVDAVTGAARPAAPAETVRLDGAAATGRCDGVLFAATSPDGTRVAVITDSGDANLCVTPARRPNPRDSPTSPMSSLRSPGSALRTVTRMHASPHPLDDDVPVLWWAPDGTRLYFQARDPAHDLALYEVPLDHDEPRVVSRSRGELTEFRLDAARNIAVCLEAFPTRPAEVAVVDLRDGGMRTLTDLNPGWRTRRFGRVRRVEATNVFGDLRTRPRPWANLVYPPDYRPGARYPMVVTTYLSQGFLRGATGDEYPIHVLAASGFLVLDLMHPREYEIDPPGPGDTPASRFEAMWKDMEGPLSTIATMIEALDGEGVLDRDRIGICGLSHGTDIATYALESSDLFRAASLCGLSHDDEYTYQLYGPGFEARWRDWGMEGGPHGPNADHWRRRSPGAENITAAILTHDSETEYLGSMSVYSRLVRAGVPIEMHVYPGEDHVKIQPRHRLEIYRRNVDWFDFWLRDSRDPDPAKDDQYRRWTALRDGAPGLP